MANFIQATFSKAKKKGTAGDCTGDKYGSSSCPPGTRKYNFAKLMRRLAHEKDMRITTKAEKANQ